MEWSDALRRRAGGRAQRAAAAAVLAVVLGVLFLPAARLRADDDEVVVDNVNQFVVSENQIEQWVFRSNNGNVSAKQKVDGGLKLEIDLVKTAISLTDDQEKKLELAGRGDIARFFNELNIQKKKFPAGAMNQERFNQMWQQIQPLTARYQAGLHGRGSLFHKMLPIILTSEQLEQYRQFERERQRRHYKAKIEIVLTVVDQRIPLTHEQRQKLIALILEKSEPPKVYGQNDFYLVMWRISQIPEKDIRPIFDDQEWKAFTRMTQQVRGMGQWVQQMEAGLDDDPDKPGGARGGVIFGF